MKEHYKKCIGNIAAIGQKGPRRGWPDLLEWTWYRTDRPTRFSTEAREATVCDIPNLSYRTWRAFPVPRSRIVSLAALFTASLSLSTSPHLWCIERGVSSLVNTFDPSPWTLWQGLLASKMRVARLSILQASGCRTMWTVRLVHHDYSPDGRPELFIPPRGLWLVGRLNAVTPSEWKGNPN